MSKDWQEWRLRSFIKNTVKMGDCLVWQGRKAGYGEGYGAFDIGPVCNFYIHRFVLSQKLGRQLEEQSLHTCDVSLCINEEHLYEGTQAQNLKDSLERGRRSQSRKGKVNGRCNTSEEVVLEVRKLWATGKYRKIDIARKLNLTDVKVHRILKPDFWM